jgi:hypothetical protein
MRRYYINPGTGSSAQYKDTAMPRSVLPVFFTLLLLTSCGKQEDAAPDGLDAQRLLDRAETFVNSVKSMYYTMVYSVQPAGRPDTTNSIYEVLLEPLPGDPYGYRLFARSLSGYHALYDGHTALLGVPDSVMTVYGPEQNPAQRLDRSFAGNARITYVHGKTMFDGVRGSRNIENMDVEKVKWRDGHVYRLRIHFGKRPPMMGGTLEIMFRSPDYLPVRVAETLNIDQDGQTQTQYYAAELTRIELNRPVADGQFTRAALPAETKYVDAPDPVATAP